MLPLLDSCRDAEGGVWSWGRGEWGRLGHNDASDCLVPTRIECDELPLATEAYAGEAHSACVLRDGRCFTWGSGHALGLDPSALTEDDMPASWASAGNYEWAPSDVLLERQAHAPKLVEGFYDRVMPE